MKLKSRIIKSELVAWNKFEWLQSESLKNISEKSFEKLKKSILENGFIQPFNVWFEESTNTHWILDGHHRKRAIDELVSEGLLVMPELLNATFIDCKNKQEASKFLLLYSSEYAHMTQEGFNEFIEQNEINIEYIENEIDIEGIEFEPEIAEEVVSTEPELDEQFVVKVRCGDVITIETEYYSSEFYIQDKNGKELTDGQEYVLLSAIKAFHSKLKNSKLLLNGTPCSFIDLCEGL